jgi:hypothetical protein
LLNLARSATLELPLLAAEGKSTVSQFKLFPAGAPVNTQTLVARFQSVYTASELSAAGLKAQQDILGVGLLVAASQTTNAHNLVNFRVGAQLFAPGRALPLISQSNGLPYFRIQSIPERFSGLVQSYEIVRGQRLVSTFSTAMPWDGTSDLLLEWSFANSAGQTDILSRSDIYLRGNGNTCWLPYSTCTSAFYHPSDPTTQTGCTYGGYPFTGQCQEARDSDKRMPATPMNMRADVALVVESPASPNPEPSSPANTSASPTPSSIPSAPATPSPTPCAVVCPLHSSCVSGQCRCEAGWAPPAQCTTCASGYWGTQCLPCGVEQLEAGPMGFVQAENGVGVSPCGGHGACNGSGTSGGNGKCKCDPGYAGPQCQHSNTGTCSGHGVAQPDGTCVCEARWAGSGCAECATRYYGTSCERCPECNDRAKCDAGLQGSGKCVCLAAQAVPPECDGASTGNDWLLVALIAACSGVSVAGACCCAYGRAMGPFRGVAGAGFLASRDQRGSKQIKPVSSHVVATQSPLRGTDSHEVQLPAHSPAPELVGAAGARPETATSGVVVNPLATELASGDQAVTSDRAVRAAAAMRAASDETDDDGKAAAVTE